MRYAREQRITGVAAALALAAEIMADPENHAVHCECGCTFLSGAVSKKDQLPVCIACGKICEKEDDDG